MLTTLIILFGSLALCIGILIVWVAILQKGLSESKRKLAQAEAAIKTVSRTNVLINEALAVEVDKTREANEDINNRTYFK